MSRTRRFLDGIGLAYFQMIGLMVLGLWLTPFLLKRIGQHDYGLWLVGTQLLSYLALMDFGVVGLLPRETAYATGLERQDAREAQLQKVVGQTARLVLWQTPVVAFVALLMWRLMPSDWGLLRGPLGLVMIALVALFPLRLFQAILQGLQDLGFLGKVQIATSLLGIAILVALVIGGSRLYALSVSWATTQVSIAMVCAYRLKKRFPYAWPSRFPQLSKAVAKTQLGKGFWVSLGQVATVLLTGTDVLIISKVFGPAAVVPYAITGKLISVLANQPQIVMSLAQPALAELRVGARERLFAVCGALTQATLLLSGAVACVVLGVNHAFVSWWVGENQFAGQALTAALLAAMLLRHWSFAVAQAIFAFGYERRICVTLAVDASVTAVSGFFLVRRLGPIGMPIASAACACIFSLPINLAALAKESEVHIFALIAPLWGWAWRCGVLFLLISTLTRIWLPRTFLLLGVTTAALAMLYGGFMYAIAMRDPLGSYVRPRLLGLKAKVFR